MSQADYTHRVCTLFRYTQDMLGCSAAAVAVVVVCLHKSLYDLLDCHIDPSIHLSNTHTLILAHNALCYRLRARAKEFFSPFFIHRVSHYFLLENELMNAFALNLNLGKDIQHAFLMPHQMK